MTVSRMVLHVLPPPLLCMDLVLQRYHFGGQVWLLAQEVDRLPAVSSWALRRRDPAISGRRLRLAVGTMHPRLAFTLPMVRQMALAARGPGAQALFEVVNAEIEAGRHLHPGGS